MKWITKIDRVAAWVLGGCILAYGFTGFDMQLHFLSPMLSGRVHLVYLFIVAQAAFAFHTTYAIHLAFKRWNIWNWLGKSLIGLYIAVNAFLFCLFIISHL
jgi:Ca2+/Na+ antiporter